MYSDPTGHFVITVGMLITGLIIGASVGAGVGLGTTIAKDLENGKLFDGDVTFLSYLGNTLGGGIAGAGIGLCSVLGAGLGAALFAGASLTIGGTTILNGTALALSISGAFVAGGLGYIVRTGISDQENFEWSDMFIEAGANAFSGMLTFAGAMVGGITGIKVPGAKFSFENFALYHLGLSYFGVYPIKFMLAYIKKSMKEKY